MRSHVNDLSAAGVYFVMQIDMSSNLVRRSPRDSPGLSHTDRADMSPTPPSIRASVASQDHTHSCSLVLHLCVANTH